MSIRIMQEANYKGGNWWQWSVWLDGTTKELDAVDHVTYTLHPTFPTPVRRIDTRRNGFRLDSAGWGEFEIYLDIALKDGRTRKRTHYLKLQDSEKTEDVANVKRKASRRAIPSVATGARSIAARAGATSTPGAVPAQPGRKGPAVFISGGVMDTATLQALGSALKSNGAEVLGPQQISSSVPFAKDIDDMIARSNAAVFVISGRPNLWLAQEIEAARRHHVGVIVPVLVGSSAAVPEALKDYKAIRIDRPEQIVEVANGFANLSFGPGIADKLKRS
jgi:hypothetical protein